MLQLFYATGDINWDDGVAKNIKVATFLQEVWLTPELLGTPENLQFWFHIV
jgi:hypothetical protein